MEMRRVREKLKRKKKDLERMRTETKTEDPALDGNRDEDGRPSA
jgi:hypothetical protein